MSPSERDEMVLAAAHLREMLFGPVRSAREGGFVGIGAGKLIAYVHTPREAWPTDLPCMCRQFPIEFRFGVGRARALAAQGQ